MQHVTAYSCKATFINESKAARFFHRGNPVSGSCFFHLRFSRLQPYHLGNMTIRGRKRRSSAGKTASSAPLPDLTPNMSLSAICQLPAAALKQYAQLYQLFSDGNKQTLAQRLHAQALQRQTRHPAMSPVRVTTKVRAARTSVPTKMMALHNRAAARVHPRASTPPRDRGVILGH